MGDQIWLWVGFNVFVLAMLAVDLFVFHKEAHEVTSAEAATWTVVWMALALLFGAGVMRSWDATPGWSTSPVT